MRGWAAGGSKARSAVHENVLFTQKNQQWSGTGSERSTNLGRTQGLVLWDGSEFSVFEIYTQNCISLESTWRLYKQM